jgi:hypothetical protein
MNIYATISLFIAFCICSNECFAQATQVSCNGMPQSYKRYEVEYGSLKYDVYTLNGKGKKKSKLLTINITYTKYGSSQNINLTVHNLPNYKVLQSDSSFSIDSNKFLLNYFVLDSCSFFYKGINLIKPIDEKYRDKKCIRFIQYRFDDYNGRTNTGTVKYCEGIPVYIRGGVPNKYLIWELQ